MLAEAAYKSTITFCDAMNARDATKGLLREARSDTLRDKECQGALGIAFQTLANAMLIVHFTCNDELLELTTPDDADIRIVVPNYSVIVSEPDSGRVHCWALAAFCKKILVLMTRHYTRVQWEAANKQTLYVGARTKRITSP